MDTLTIMAITAFVSIALTSIIFAYGQSRKNGEKEIPWDAIRPILSEMFTEVILFMEARKEGYQSVENHAVSYVKNKIDESSFLTIEEKALLSERLIRSIIAPRLKEIYEKETTKEG